MWPGPDSILRRAAPSKDADAAVAKATLLAFPSIFSERGEGPDGHWRGGKSGKRDQITQPAGQTILMLTYPLPPAKGHLLPHP